MDPTSSNILRMITSLQFVSKLGFSLRGALKNGTQRLLNFSFDTTKIEDSCMGGVVVNYGYNYSTEKFDKRTGKRIVKAKKKPARKRAY